MKTSDKKLGILKETLRYNFQTSSIVGTIEGDVNTNIKKGFKWVSVTKEGTLVFWRHDDFEVTISSDDVVGCKVLSYGDRGFGSSGKYWYGPTFELKFTNGTVGRLVVDDICVEAAEYIDLSVADVPKVDGWVAADGARDEHYNDGLCPEGYKPNILGYYKSIPFTRSQLPKVDNILKLSERFPDNFDASGNVKGAYTFDGAKSMHYIKNYRKK